MDRDRLRSAAQSNRVRLPLLFALCAVPVMAEAYLVEAVGTPGSVGISPQASAFWPYGTLHDLRWVLVYHRSWAGFVGESLAAITARGLLCTALTAIAWPREAPRPSLGRLAARNLLFTALLGMFLSPWAAMGIVASDVSVSWYVFGELVPVLIMAPVLQRGGIVAGWWRGLPPAGTTGLALLNFATLTAGGVLVFVVPEAVREPVAGLVGGVNGLLWAWAVRIAALHREVRWARVPVFPIVVAVVIGFMFTIGDIAESGTRKPEVSEPPAVGQLEAHTANGPVVFLAGYNSHYDGEASGRTPPILRFSYQGTGSDGAPKAYKSTDTHQSLVTSSQLLARQVDDLHRSTGRPVSLLAESEGALVAHYYLVTMPHPNVRMVVLLSPPIRAGRSYYPPRQADTGWGVATGWELRGIFAVLGVAGGLPNSADEPFIRSLMDNAPLFRGNRMLCPVDGVETIAFLPTLDAAAVPPGLRAGIPIIEVPGPHGLLIDRPLTERRVVQFLNAGTANTRHSWDYDIIQRSGAAWQAPPLRLDLNRAWHNFPSRSENDIRQGVCPRQ
jgi:hypothetical protein